MVPMPTLTVESVTAALAGVIDPEIRRPITDLGMVRSVAVEPGPDGAAVTVGIDLTTAGCPLKETLTRDTTAVVSALEGVASVSVQLGVMSDEQRLGLRTMLRGGAGEPVIPFAQPGSLTRVYAIASGKGGVGKSSVTANLAAAMAADGLSVGGHRGGQPVVWRGPMLHRALQQFLADVFWGDLDVLLLDLPPGTGDIAISVAQMLPSSELVIVTTPQVAAAEVAERAGSIALQTRQHIAGVVENMSWLEQADGSRLELFGAGGGATVADSLSRATGAPVPLLAQVPLDMALREAGDEGTPVVLSAPDSPAAVALRSVARALGQRSRGLAGRSLGLSPVPR